MNGIGNVSRIWPNGPAIAGSLRFCGPGFLDGANNMDCWGTPKDEFEACTDAIICVGDGKGESARPLTEIFLWRSGCFDGREGAVYSCVN